MNEPQGIAGLARIQSAMLVNSLEDLSPRERDAIELLTNGCSNEEIADRLEISVNSVKVYLRAAYREIGAEHRGQAIVWGVRKGLLVDLATAGQDAD